MPSTFCSIAAVRVKHKWGGLVRHTHANGHTLDARKRMPGDGFCHVELEFSIVIVVLISQEKSAIKGCVRMALNKQHKATWELYSSYDVVYL